MRASSPPLKPVPPVSAERLDRLDALRGLAIVWMAIFHFSFDLNHFGWIHQDFYRDPVWTWQRTCIVSLFLFCAGGGQAFAVLAGQSARRFWRRWVWKSFFTAARSNCPAGSDSASLSPEHLPIHRS